MPCLYMFIMAINLQLFVVRVVTTWKYVNYIAKQDLKYCPGH